MNYREGDAQCSIPKLAFKAVENFFRRISFNLGNTPSETDIKIVSCIPVDVSDLQAKILCLEKELETHKKRGVKFKNSAVHTTLISQNFYTDSMATQTRPDEVRLDEYVYLQREAKPKQGHTTSTVNQDQNNINRVPSLAYDIMGIENTDNRTRRQNGGHNKIRVQREHQAYHTQVHTPLQGNDWNSLVENDIIRKSDKNIKSHSLNIDTFSNLSRNNLTFNRDSLCDSDICLRTTDNQANFETNNHVVDDNTVILSPKHSERGINNNATTSKFYNDRYYDLIPVKIHGNNKSREKGSPIANLMEELAMNKTNYKHTDTTISCDEECQSTHNQPRNHVIQDIFKRKTNTDETSKHSKDFNTSKQRNIQAQNLIITEETPSRYSNNYNNDTNYIKPELKTKTDETLSEIKTILKSVVNLVKRRSSRTMSARKRGSHLPKKDANVQKDLNELPIERVRLYQPPQLEPDNYPYYPCRPMVPIIQSCFVPPHQNPYYSFNPVGHYYQGEPRQMHCYSYRY